MKAKGTPRGVPFFVVGTTSLSSPSRPAVRRPPVKADGIVIRPGETRPNPRVRSTLAVYMGTGGTRSLPHNSQLSTLNILRFHHHLQRLGGRGGGEGDGLGGPVQAKSMGDQRADIQST